MIKKVSLLVCSVLLSQTALANNENRQSVIDAFINCDNSFFYQLKENAQDFNDITDLIVKDDIAYIPVHDVSNNEENTTVFKQPVEYRGITLTSYKNIALQISGSGQYFYWGFVIDGSVDDVKNVLSELTWQQYNSTSYVANTTLFDRGVKKGSWQNNPYVIDGVAPRYLTVEKSLFLEPLDDKKVHLVCSVQGDLNSDLLYAVRPDMKYIDEEIKAKHQVEIEKKKELEMRDNQSNSSTIEQEQIGKEI